MRTYEVGESRDAGTVEVGDVCLLELRFDPLVLASRVDGTGTHDFLERLSLIVDDLEGEQDCNERRISTGRRIDLRNESYILAI
jgi:hypothetical protein